jgi:beta-mannosidase
MLNTIIVGTGGPRFITCGIWRRIFLVGWNNLKLNYVQVIQKEVIINKADIISILEVESTEDQTISVDISNGEESYEFNRINLTEGINKIELPITILNPKLWWTIELGEQYLYDFS